MSNITVKVFSYGQKCDLHKMAEIEKRGCGNLCHLPSCGKGIHIRWQYLIIFITLFNSIKKIVQSCGYVGLSGYNFPQY